VQRIAQEDKIEISSIQGDLDQENKKRYQSIQGEGRRVSRELPAG
jgi:hypothetical protein